MSLPTSAPHLADVQTQIDLKSLRSVQSALSSRIATFLVADDDQGRTSKNLSGLADLHNITKTLIAHGDNALKWGYDAYDQDLYPVVESSIGSICAAITASESEVETVSTLAKGYAAAYNAFEWPAARLSGKACFEREKRRVQAGMSAAQWVVGQAQALLEEARGGQASWSRHTECDWSGSDGMEEAMDLAKRGYNEWRWVHDQVTAACSVLGVDRTRSQL